MNSERRYSYAITLFNLNLLFKTNNPSMDEKYLNLNLTENTYESKLLFQTNL